MGLAEYLVSCAGRKFEWGVHDCCTFTADWWNAETGKDPLEKFRGTYSTKREAVKEILRFGSLRNAWASEMGECSETLSAGSVGIIKALLDGGLGECGAIYTGSRWAALSEHGVFYSMPDSDDILGHWNPHG